MLGIALSAALAVRPSLAPLEALAEAQQWDELYLKAATLRPGDLPTKEGETLAALLAQGCASLLHEDAPLALGLGEKSAEFGSSVDGFLCASEAATRSDQRGAALAVLSAGTKRWPRDARLSLERGRLLLDDGDTKEAAAVLGRVRQQAPQYAEAQKLLAIAKRLEAEVKRARAELGRQHEAAEDAQRRAGLGGPHGRAVPGSTPDANLRSSGSWASSVDDEGRRQRGNSHFRFRYFSGKKDFGQRAEYEGRVQGTLEDAKVAVERTLGAGRRRPVDVVLYSREEFALHHGEQAASAVAGFYSGSAIRMNDSAEMTPQVRATMVHEYTHAVLDELSGFKPQTLPTWLNEGIAEYVSWKAQGSDRPPFQQAVQLKELAARGALPPLEQLSRGPLLGQGDAGLLYALSGSAVRLMVARAGLPGVLKLIRTLGASPGASFDKEFERCVGKPQQRFADDLKAELASQ
jgi:hypothetical protein